jgi:hypothetical protein
MSRTGAGWSGRLPLLLLAVLLLLALLGTLGVHRLPGDEAVEAVVVVA